jgi:hypothetical protein
MSWNPEMYCQYALNLKRRLGLKSFVVDKEQGGVIREAGGLGEELCGGEMQLPITTAEGTIKAYMGWGVLLVGPSVFPADQRNFVQV